MAAENFWSASFRLYRLPRIERSCLALQDNHDVNVVMLLYCCWLGSYRQLLSNDECQQALKEVNLWSGKLITPIRTARRWLKEQNDNALYKQVLECELAAEKGLMERLEQLASSALSGIDQHTPSLECAQKNTSLYFQQTGIVLDQTGQNALDIIFSAL